MMLPEAHCVPGLVITPWMATQRDSERIQNVIRTHFEREKQMAATAPPGERAREATSLLPLSRVKRVMKQEAWQNDGQGARMVSVPAVLHTAHIAQLLVSILTRLAWDEFVAPDKRNTLQLKDIQRAVRLSSKFDFLVDVLVAMGHESALAPHGAPPVAIAPGTAAAAAPSAGAGAGGASGSATAASVSA